MTNSIKKAMPSFLLGVLWLFEGIPFLSFENVDSAYVLWGVTFIFAYTIFNFLMFGSELQYILQEKQPPLRPGAKVVFVCFCVFTFVGSLISSVLLIQKSNFGGLIFPVFTVLLLLWLYHIYFNSKE